MDEEILLTVTVTLTPSTLGLVLVERNYLSLTPVIAVVNPRPCHPNLSIPHPPTYSVGRQWWCQLLYWTSPTHYCHPRYSTWLVSWWCWLVSIRWIPLSLHPSIGVCESRRQVSSTPISQEEEDTTWLQLVSGWSWNLPLSLPPINGDEPLFMTLLPEKTSTCLLHCLPSPPPPPGRKRERAEPELEKVGESGWVRGGAVAPSLLNHRSGRSW